MTFMKLLDYQDILLADITHKIDNDNFHNILGIFQQIKIFFFNVELSRVKTLINFLSEAFSVETLVLENL